MFFAMSVLSCKAISAIIIDLGVETRETYSRNKGSNRSTKQCVGWWITPVLVAWAKLRASEMSSDSRHGHFTSSPWRAKVEFETVVLDVFVASITLNKEKSNQETSA
jgi:hypothetical protein